MAIIHTVLLLCIYGSILQSNLCTMGFILPFFLICYDERDFNGKKTLWIDFDHQFQLLYSYNIICLFRSIANYYKGNDELNLPGAFYVHRFNNSMNMSTYFNIERMHSWIFPNY